MKGMELDSVSETASRGITELADQIDKVQTANDLMVNLMTLVATHLKDSEILTLLNRTIQTIRPGTIIDL